MATEGRATEILERMAQGDRAAGEELGALLYAELHRIAEREMGGVGQAHTLQPTALVGEAWIKLIDTSAVDWKSRSHFLGTAALAMRSILVDHARKRAALKRGGAEGRVALDDVVVLFEENAIDLVALEEAMERLAKVDEELVRIVELRYYGGLTQPEIAEVMGTSLRTVERGWTTARTWLYRELSGDAS